MGASSSKVAGDSRPNANTGSTQPTDQNMGNVSSGMSPMTQTQQQAMAAAMTPLDVMHNLSREEMKNSTPTRPARLGDPVPIDDKVKQAEAMQRVQDAQTTAAGSASAQQAQREPAAVREGKYSIYTSPVACNRMPNVFPLDDCLRASQHQFFEARQALRHQRQMCLPCNKCYGDYGTNSGGNIAKAFGDGNDVRGARTNEALMSRDVRTMAANMQARQRLLHCNARPSQLEHVEPTTKMSPAASAIEALASQTTNSAQERNATAVEAVVVQKSMSPSTSLTNNAAPNVVTSPAMTATAKGAAAAAATTAPATVASAPAMQAPNKGNGSLQTTEMLLNGEIQGGRWSPSVGNMGCGCAGTAASQKIVSPTVAVCNGADNKNGNGRLVALKRMQQGIQSRQDFCEFDFCPVV